MKNYVIRVLAIITTVFISTESANAGFLRFPVYGYTKSNATVTSVMDHDNTVGSIRTYTGQTGSISDGCKAYVNKQNVACTSSNTSAPRGYKKSGGGAWSVSGMNYADYTDGGYNWYMWYDNHNGYDFGVPQWTQVVASEGGTIVAINSTWGQITIDHGNGYRTTYTHMYLLLPQMSTVAKGAALGWVSNVSPDPIGPHLHFTVRRYLNGVWTLVDPYGGSGQPVLWE